jgi:hypothetical protein
VKLIQEENHRLNKQTVHKFLTSVSEAWSGNCTVGQARALCRRSHACREYQRHLAELQFAIAQLEHSQARQKAKGESAGTDSQQDQ